MNDVKSWHSMDLGQEYTYEIIGSTFYRVKRVPGGWIFMCDKGITFVPHSCEGRGL